MLNVQGISFGYHRKLVISDITFDCRAGEIVGIAGPSGYGKTTLAKLIAGVLSPQTGSITIDRQSATDMSDQQGIAYIQQHAAGLLPAFSVYTNTAMASLIGQHKLHTSRLRFHDRRKVVRAMRMARSITPRGNVQISFRAACKHGH